MSDTSEQMEFSPTKFEQVASCEKFRDTVTGISALHKSLHEMDGRSPSPRNSYKDLYLSATQAMIRRKEELSRILSTQHPLSNEKEVTTEVVTPKKTLLHPIMLKIKDNFREQIKCISEKFPNLRNRIANDVVKMFSNDHEEYRTLIHFLESDKEFEFYVIKRQNVKPIKAVIKGLPSSSKIVDITNDLAEIEFKIDSCTQLTSKRTKKSLPYFLVILPRNDYNSKIFDIAKLGYSQSNDNWTSKLKALGNSLWAVQKFLKNKCSDIAALNSTSGMAVTDDQKANILANTILTNFTEKTNPIVIKMKMAK
ncbi:hypothetical protein TNCV_4235601 [Trichonephila clavipes]|nr:hypothetical protein TNCV_4235601 [Trichonephila clavipes]